uniref:Uncharacterized protein n=2 Tax=Sarcophilus harrisii TaxID=9305 RepID=A0A7N4P5S8_SARHA
GNVKIFGEGTKLIVT